MTHMKHECVNPVLSIASLNLKGVQIYSLGVLFITVNHFKLKSLATMSFRISIIRIYSQALAQTAVINMQQSRCELRLGPSITHRTKVLGIPSRPADYTCTALFPHTVKKYKQKMHQALQQLKSKTTKCKVLTKLLSLHVYEGTI